MKFNSRKRYGEQTGLVELFSLFLNSTDVNVYKRLNFNLKTEIYTIRPSRKLKLS